MESREVLTLHLMAWERAKGELRAMLPTFWPTPSVHHDPETLARDPMVKRLLSAGAKTDPVDRMNKSAIVYAAGRGHTEAVDLLLASGIDVDQPYEHQLTLLMWASGQGHPELVRLLLGGSVDHFWMEINTHARMNDMDGLWQHAQLRARDRWRQVRSPKRHDSSPATSGTPRQFRLSDGRDPGGGGTHGHYPCNARTKRRTDSRTAVHGSYLNE
jgi:ankyrin repeat protein